MTALLLPETKVLISGTAPFLAALLAYWLGLRAYRQQKEQELVRERYLDGAVDQVAAQTAHALSVFRNNWNEALALLKLIRDVGPKIGTVDYASRVTTLDAATLDMRANYRLNDLVGDLVFWEAQQQTVALVTCAASFYRDDLCVAARFLAAGQQPTPELSDRYFSIAMALDELAKPHYQMLAQLQRLTSVLEKEHFTLRTIRHFRTRPEVIEIVRTARDIFDKHLAKGVAAELAEHRKTYETRSCHPFVDQAPGSEVTK